MGSKSCDERYGRRRIAVLKHLDTRFTREDGQTMPEYAVVLALLTITAAAVFAVYSGSVVNAMTSVTGVI